MATYESTVNREQLSGLLTNDPGLQGLVETVLHQVLEAQGTEQIGVRPSARSAGRKADRQGARPRPLTTRVGPLVLHIPQLRAGSVSTPLLTRSQRSEHAVLLALMGRTPRHLRAHMAAGLRRILQAEAHATARAALPWRWHSQATRIGRWKSERRDARMPVQGCYGLRSIGGAYAPRI